MIIMFKATCFFLECVEILGGSLIVFQLINIELSTLFYIGNADKYLKSSWNLSILPDSEIYITDNSSQCSKLTFSKSRFLAAFNCKMVATKKIQSPKKHEGEDTSWHIARGANVPNSTFSTLYFATVSWRIHVEFLNDESWKVKDRWCLCFYYWLNFVLHFALLMFFFLVAISRLSPEIWSPNNFSTCHGDQNGRSLECC